MHRRSNRTRLAAVTSAIVITVLASFVLASASAAASVRITQGDAQAVLRASGNGGWALLQHNRVVQMGPDAPAAIRPFGDFNGRHYCALDWHTILIDDFEGGTSNAFTQQQAAAIIANLRVSLILDGRPLELTQTAVQRFLDQQLLQDFGLQVGYYSAWGRVMAPNDLRAGNHTLRGISTDTVGNVFFDNTITFVVDPAGAGACL